MMVKKENDNEMKVFAPQDPGAREAATFPWCVGGSVVGRSSPTPPSSACKMKKRHVKSRDPP